MGKCSLDDHKLPPQIKYGWIHEDDAVERFNWHVKFTRNSWLVHSLVLVLIALPLLAELLKQNAYGHLEKKKLLVLAMLMKSKVNYQIGQTLHDTLRYRLKWPHVNLRKVLFLFTLTRVFVLWMYHFIKNFGFIWGRNSKHSSWSFFFLFC